MADRRDRLEEGAGGCFESGYAGGHLGVAELETDIIGDAPEQRIDVSAVHGGEDFSYHPGGGRVRVGGHGHSFVGRQATAQRSRRPARLPPLAANVPLHAGTRAIPVLGIGPYQSIEPSLGQYFIDIFLTCR
jgi:hypothetical protein